MSTAGTLDHAELEASARAQIAGASSTEQLTAVEQALLGKRSALKAAKQGLGGLPPEERREAGAVLQEVQHRIEGALEERSRELAAVERAALLADDRLDLTEVVASQVLSSLGRGHLHLVTQTRDALEDVFVAMGFVVAEGPEAETDWYNFEALNIPPAHPARGMYDTMYLDIGEPETVLLRTHTSPVQIRTMKEHPAPIAIVVPGKVYRRDALDARHLYVFHQIEGLQVGPGIHMGHLKGVLTGLCRELFGPNQAVRFRPSFFPFTEPSAEVDTTCPACGGTGCRTCSGSGWIEICGAGMVHPAVLREVGYDPDVVSGWAFGMGIERVAFTRYGMDDIRVFIENDPRLLEQLA
jgi:phenylalanyl-tRNA synthetase alpha chain